MNRHLPLKTMISSLRHKSPHSSYIQVFLYRHVVDEHHNYQKNIYTASEISFSADKTAEPFSKRNGKNKWKPRWGAAEEEESALHKRQASRLCPQPPLVGRQPEPTSLHF